jgi:predicted P-loop ATPase
LADETGNRRWLPVRVGDVDVAGIRRDHALLWAEAKVLFDEGGVHYKGVEKLAEAVHDEHTIHDSWCDVVNQWLDTPDDLTGEIPRTRKFLRVSEVLVEALGFIERNITRREETRMSATFRTLGYVRKKSRVNGKSVWGFVPLL